jgi:hypothetical protein
MLEDRGGLIFHKKENDYFCIEIPNLFSNIKTSSSTHNFILLLPSTEAMVSPESLGIV